MKVHFLIPVFLMSIFNGRVLAIIFQQGAGNVKWAADCDFDGGDFANQLSPGEQCGGICESNSQCTHFTWTNWQGGTCWLKNGPVCESSAISAQAGAVCGYVTTRSGDDAGGSWVNNIKGTFWAPASDSGGCQMPEANYAVVDALALGQQPDLQGLIWRQGLCGQVLNVDCGFGSVPAVVASTCNLGSGSCGVDMIERTWNRITNGESPGIVNCKVSLSQLNPINEAGPLCYHRPNSDLNSPFSAILGVLNTNGQISSEATIAGKVGRRNNDQWFEFNADGQPLFVPEADVQFEFEDGSSNTFKLQDCKSAGSTHIFQ